MTPTSSSSGSSETKLDRLRAMVLRCWIASGLAPSAEALQRRFKSDARRGSKAGKSPELADLEPSSKAAVVRLAVHPLKKRLGELAALSLAINVLSLAVPIFVLQVYDRVVFHGGLATLGGLVIGVFAATLWLTVLRRERLQPSG